MAATPLSKALFALAQRYDVDLIESAVVAEFLAARGLTTRNRLLLDLAARDPEAQAPVRAELRAIIPELTIDLVLRVFEMAIPSEDKDLNGAIYTPRHITDYICAKTIVRGDELVIDPSCGAGAFLLATARRLQAISGRPMGEIVERQILGRDILDYSVRHARVMMNLLALEAGDDREVIVDRLEAGDALAPEWRESLVAAGGVDVVVGNPPYIRFQELPGEVRENLSTGEWTTTGAGNFNIYFAFFEFAIKLLNERGVLGYITPSAHFGTKSAKGLRALLASNGYLDEIIDCGSTSVFEVATYTALTFLSRTPSATFTFARMDELDDQFRLDDLRRETLRSADLLDARWMLGYTEELEILAQIEQTGSPLRRIADLTVGLATLRDSLFLLGTRVEGEHVVIERGERTFRVELAVTKPVVKVSDHPTQSSLDEAASRIFFPYAEASDGSISVVDDATMRATYPGAYEYALSIRDELAKRDHGKKTYETWFAYGRRQGLSLPGRGQLLTTIYAAAPRFLVDPAPGRRFVNGYAVVPKTEGAGAVWSSPIGLRALRNLLESDAMLIYVGLTSSPIEGGYRCYAGNYIANFGVPEATEIEVAAIARMSHEEASAWYATKAGIDADAAEAIVARMTVSVAKRAA